jgi:hypothetical protein
MEPPQRMPAMALGISTLLSFGGMMIAMARQIRLFVLRFSHFNWK